MARVTGIASTPRSLTAAPASVAGAVAAMKSSSTYSAYNQPIRHIAIVRVRAAECVALRARLSGALFGGEQRSILRARRR